MVKTIDSGLQGEKLRVSGTVTRVRFQNPDTGWFVVDISQANKPALCVVGVCSHPLDVDFALACFGSMTTGKYGKQFQADEVEASPPKTTSGLRKYLSSGLFVGIGTRTADLIVDAYGVSTIDVLDNDPERLYGLKGLQRKRAQHLINSWQGASAMRTITVFALSQGITMSQIRRILKKYGDDAAKLIKEDPYRLCRDIHGIGFRKADAIARKLGVAFDSPFRIRASLTFCLETASQEGHCALQVNELVSRCSDLLAEKEQEGKNRGVELRQIADQIRPEIDAGRLATEHLRGRAHIFLTSLYQAERRIAQDLLRLKGGPLKGAILPASVDANIASACEQIGIELATEQLQAIRTGLTNKVCVITGGPGVGKTTIMRVLLHIFREMKLGVALCAPTGKAAKRLSESTGQNAMTIHRLLGYQGGSFSHSEENPLEIDATFADEFSMPDVLLTQAFLRALPSSARLIMVGDIDQLPSVGPGNVLKDIIQSEQVAVVRLTRIFRQAQTSDIVRVAHDINAGRMPSFSSGDTDCMFMQCDDKELLQAQLLQACSMLMKTGVAPQDIQVLCPMSTGDVGTYALNESLRDVLNLQAEHLSSNAGRLRVGERVMQIRNDYAKAVFNGDIGYVQSKPEEVLAGPNEEGASGELTISYADQSVAYGTDDQDALRLAYAMTIHKSQGSEFPVVIIPITTAHFVMLKRNLIYTAITRGKALVVLIGSKRALALAIKNTDDAQRVTKLKDWLSSSNSAPT